MNRLLSILVVLCVPVFLMAQYEDLEPPQHGTEYGIGFTLAMGGFGLGGYYRYALPGYMGLGASADFYMMRDDKEYEIYDPYSNFYYQLNKINRLFFIPIHVELKKRLFPNDIEDNFRPYLVGGAGGVFGMNFPRKTQVEGGDYPRKNEFRFTVDFYFGFGVDITTNEDYYFSIRPQIRFVQFAQSIAGDRNHSTFEIRLELGKRIVTQN